MRSDAERERKLAKGFALDIPAAPGPGGGARAERSDTLPMSRRQGPPMNSFYEHHKDSIRFHYRCFDRILLNGLIRPFQQPERVVGFFDTYRQLYPVSRDTLRGIADRFQPQAAQVGLIGLEPSRSGHGPTRAEALAGADADLRASRRPRVSSGGPPVVGNGACTCATPRRVPHGGVGHGRRLDDGSAPPGLSGAAHRRRQGRTSARPG